MHLPAGDEGKSSPFSVDVVMLGLDLVKLGQRQCLRAQLDRAFTLSVGARSETRRRQPW